MEKLLTYLTQEIVEHPEQVAVTTVSEKDDTTVYKIMVEASDMGRVIGKQGRIAKAIRTVAKSVAAKNNKKVIVNIGD